MSGRLTGYVGLVNPETGRRESFGPGDEVPSWARQQITNPAAWTQDEGTGPEPAPEPAPSPAANTSKPSARRKS